MANLPNKREYVSRAGLKLASVAEAFKLDFKGQQVLDIGSSTGGFTDYALQHGSKKVIAVDVGTNQLHPKLRTNSKVELHEKTDIRSVYSINSPTPGRNVLPGVGDSGKVYLDGGLPTIILIDISFMSLRYILPHVAENLCDIDTQIIAMVKPQFEAKKQQLNKGIVKNEAMRREILKEFELWSRSYFVISGKKDSEVSGSKGNQERFYLLKLTA